ncbi:TlpA family protein disulfide reductase [Chondromyces apiculatus]|uniref:TlpA family protein disulfide reductase n=1 Tax=Chondromyces apiculatus TaxID=51 RepID=UPI001E41F6B0|nr:TlpA family protein disulfide reductase [Chondromyces apiculatus]
MREHNLVLRAGPVLVGLALLSGCGGEELAPPFPEGSGQDAVDVSSYPEGPYGINIGSKIANYKFVGYSNAAVVNDALQEIHLSDFYNPDGNAVYAEEGREAQYGAGVAKPKALLIVVSSVWCGPCNYEADEVLPVKYEKHKPVGGEYLLQLADGPTPGAPAGQEELYRWTRKYDVNYPSAIDPSYKLGALFSADAFPANMIIDTRDMSIVEVVAGSPNASFWKKFEKVIDGTL